MSNFVLQQKKNLSGIILLFCKKQLEAMCWKASSAQPIKEAMLQLTVNQLKQLVVSFFPCCCRSRDQLDREHHSLECITTTR